GSEPAVERIDGQHEHGRDRRCEEGDDRSERSRNDIAEADDPQPVRSGCHLPDDERASELRVRRPALTDQVSVQAWEGCDAVVGDGLRFEDEQEEQSDLDADHATRARSSEHSAKSTAEGSRTASTGGLSTAKTIASVRMSTIAMRSMPGPFSKLAASSGRALNITLAMASPSTAATTPWSA